MVLGSSQFLLLPQLPKNTTCSKMVESESKINISLHWSKFVTLTLYKISWETFTKVKTIFFSGRRFSTAWTDSADLPETISREEESSKKWSKGKFVRKNNDWRNLDSFLSVLSRRPHQCVKNQTRQYLSKYNYKIMHLFNLCFLLLLCVKFSNFVMLNCFRQI